MRVFHVVCILASVFATSYSFTKFEDFRSREAVDVDNRCCMCGDDIAVTLFTQNALVQPVFNVSTSVTGPQRELINFLEQASRQDPTFRFTARYNPTYGFLLTGMNGVESRYDVDKTCWEIGDANGLINTGLSTYVPSNNGIVVFTFTHCN